MFTRQYGPEWTVDTSVSNLAPARIAIPRTPTITAAYLVGVRRG